MPALPVVPIVLNPEQEDALKKYIRQELGPAREAHANREKTLAGYKRAYKAKPEHDVKNFPWQNASNVVIPIVAITVDNIVARLKKAFLGTKDPFEAQILDKGIDPDGTLEKDFRDWASLFLDKSEARDTINDMFHDMSVDGDAFLKCIWETKDRPIHAYASDGGVVTQIKIDYDGPVWHSIPKADLIRPEGYDSWKKIPWIAERLRWTWIEMRELVDQGYLDKKVLDLKGKEKERDDERFKVQQQNQKVEGFTSKIFEWYEIWGKWEVPPDASSLATKTEKTPDQLGTVVEECIITYSFDHDVIGRIIYNPFFSKARYIVRVPFLHQPHELDGLGVAEMSLPFQEEASTAHNQEIDSATAAIAGIVVRAPSVTMDAKQDIYPGAQIVADNPKDDINVIHLSMGTDQLGNVAQQAAFWNEKRTGVSAYNMGVESPIAGSRATATGTTALIGEGNTRFWVSIDDMRDAIVELLYLTLTLIQQMLPDGAPITESRMLQLPPGDLRSTIGLRLAISSEKINKDLEIQALQNLMSILQQYYQQVMNFGGMVLNPNFPPAQKQLAEQVMTSAQMMVKRICEHFDLEDIDAIVPGIQEAMQLLQSAGGNMQGQPNGPGQVAPPVGGPAGALPGASPNGPQAVPQGPRPVPQRQGGAPGPGQGQVPRR